MNLNTKLLLIIIAMLGTVTVTVVVKNNPEEVNVTENKTKEQQRNELLRTDVKPELNNIGDWR